MTRFLFQGGQRFMLLLFITIILIASPARAQVYMNTHLLNSPFESNKQLHIFYDLRGQITAYNNYTYVYKLEAVDSNGVVSDIPVKVGSSEIIKWTPPKQGQYDLRLLQDVYYKGEYDSTDEIALNNASATGIAQGTLKIDEEMTGDVQVAVITINDGATLTLNNVTFTNDNSTCYIDVKGDLIVSGLSYTTPCRPVFRFYKPYSLAGLTDAGLVFAAGAAGSEITDSQGLCVELQTGGVKLSGIADLGLSLKHGGGDVGIENSTVRLLQGTVPSGGELLLTDVGLIGTGEISVHGKLTMEGSRGKGVHFRFFAPHDLDYAEDLTLTFEAGSEGSKLTNSGGVEVTRKKNIDLTVNMGDIKVESVHIYNLTLDDGTETALFSGCAVTGDFEMPAFSRAATVTFNNKTVFNPKLIYGLGQPADRHADSRVILDDCIIKTNISVGEGFNSYLPAKSIVKNCWLYEPDKTNFKSNISNYMLSVFGGEPRLTGNRIAGTVILWSRTAATITDNIIQGPISFNNGSDLPAGALTWEKRGPSPTISGNVFLGRKALDWDFYSIGDPSKWEDYKPIAIGSNYYGDRNNYGRNFTTAQRFLTNRGATVDTHYDSQPTMPIFDIAAPKESMKKSWDYKKVPPKFWEISHIAGQNSIPHDPARNSRLLKGKDTLLCLDIGADIDKLTGVKVYLKIDGKEIYPAKGSVKDLYRDLYGYGSAGSRVTHGAATYNFILPPTLETYLDYEVWVDPQGIGFDLDPDEFKLLPHQISSGGIYGFYDPPKGVLKILVCPAVTMLGQPDAGAYINILNSLIPAVMPLHASNFLIGLGPGIDSGLAAQTGNAVMVGVITNHNAVQAKESIYWNSLLWGGMDPDFIIILYPDDGLGRGVEGTWHWLHPTVIHVAQNHPLGTFHEWGHMAGLYRNPEQYDQHDPPWGLLLRQHTVFINDAKAHKYRPGLMVNRWIHLGANPGDWWDTNTLFGEIMSAYKRSWPSLDTQKGYQSWIDASVKPPEARKEVRPARSTRAPADGLRRISITALAVRGESVESLYELDRETLVVKDMTGLAPDTPPTLYFINHHYMLEAFDISGQSISKVRFGLVHPFDRPENFLFACTVDLPDTVHRLTITDAGTIGGPNPDVLYDRTASGQLGNRLLAPASGAVLDPKTQVKWSASQTGLTHTIYYSPNNGAAWKVLVSDLRTDGFTMDTSYWKPGQYALQLLTSDGLKSVSKQVKNLTVPNRSPFVEILSPRPDDRGEPVLGWNLIADAHTSEDKSIITDTGKWTSSADGELGAGSVLENVILSPGEHLLTYSVADSTDLFGQASVRVKVEDMPRVDLFLDRDSLSLLLPGRGFIGGNAELKLGYEHKTGLTVRNTGRVTGFRMVLSVVFPSGLEKTLVDRTLSDVEPFETITEAGTFVPSELGDYTLKASILEVDPADSDQANNQYFWSYSTTELSDSDGDGLPDEWEQEHFKTLARDGYGDFDGDGLTDFEEYFRNTDPADRDTDNDGMDDGWEVENGLDPLSDDSDEDADGDGYTNIQEYRGGSDPTNPNSTPGNSNPGGSISPWLILLLN